MKGSQTNSFTIWGVEPPPTVHMNSFATGFLTPVYGEKGWTDEEMDASISIGGSMDGQTDRRTDRQIFFKKIDRRGTKLPG